MKNLKIVGIGLLITAFTISIWSVSTWYMLSHGEKDVDLKKLGRNYNSLTFNEQQIKEIKANHFILDSIFRLISEASKIPINHTGYVAYDTIFYYRYCSDRLGNYIEKSSCSLQKSLDTKLVQKADIAIQSLIGLGFKGFGHQSVFDQFTLLVNCEFLESKDYRFVLIDEDLDSAFLSKTSFQIIEQKNGLVLLKEKQFPE